MKNWKLGSFLGVIVLLIVIFFALNPFVFVDAGERGVKLTWGALTGEILDPGLSFRLPVAQTVVPVNVRTQTIEIAQSEAYSKDLQVVDIHSVSNYNIKPNQVGEFYQQYGDNIDNIMSSRLEAAIKQTVAQYSAEELLQKRSEVQAEIQKAYAGSVPTVVDVTNYSLVNESFSKDFEAAIERKQIAQQDAEKAQNDLKRTQIEAEQRVAQANAEAEAIKVQSEAANNDKYIALKQLDVQLAAVAKWNGQLPVSMIPGAALPFLNLK